MPFLDFTSGSYSVQLFGITLAIGASALVKAIGWVLFASGAFCAVRERVTGKRLGTLAPLVGAGATLAVMSTGLGLVLGDSYPVFARNFCFPYALLAFAAAVLGHALQAGGRPIGEE